MGDLNRQCAFIICHTSVAHIIDEHRNIQVGGTIGDVKAEWISIRVLFQETWTVV